MPKLRLTEEIENEPKPTMNWDQPVYSSEGDCEPHPLHSTVCALNFTIFGLPAIRQLHDPRIKGRVQYEATNYATSHRRATLRAMVKSTMATATRTRTCGQR